jgi:hypothetical protein
LIENGIIFRLIFELGCPVFLIAKNLGTSEVEILRHLNGKRLSSDKKDKLKLLWTDLVAMNDIKKISI